MKSTKNILALLILITSLLGTTGCRRWSHHGHLDGMWQIQKIEYTADGVKVHKGQIVEMPELYINVGLELLECQPKGSEPTLIGVLDYDKGEGYLDVAWPPKYPGQPTPSAEALEKFGFFDNPSHVEILKLTSKHFTFRTAGAVVTCYKY